MQLRYFSAVCHLGGVTRAAERLHVSQPAITAAIQNLEDELGLLLLSRGGRTLVPTLDGEAFLALWWPFFYSPRFLRSSPEVVRKYTFG